MDQKTLQTAQDVIDLLEVIVDRYGEETLYSATGRRSCMYTDLVTIEGAEPITKIVPSCIVGCVVDLFRPEALLTLREHEIDGEDTDIATILAQEVILEDIGDQATDALILAQKLQDNGYRWGVVLERVKDVYPSKVPPS